MPSSGSDFFQWGHWEYGYLVLSPSDSPGNWLTQSYELFQSNSNFQSRKWENSTATKLNLSCSAFTPFEADFNKSLFAFLGKVEEMWLVGQWVIHDTWWCMRHTWVMIWCHVFLEISDFEFVLHSVDVVIWEIRLVVSTVHVLQNMIVCRLWKSLSRDAVQEGQKETFFPEDLMIAGIALCKAWRQTCKIGSMIHSQDTDTSMILCLYHTFQVLWNCLQGTFTFSTSQA